MDNVDNGDNLKSRIKSYNVVSNTTYNSQCDYNYTALSVLHYV